MNGQHAALTQILQLFIHKYIIMKIIRLKQELIRYECNDYKFSIDEWVITTLTERSQIWVDNMYVKQDGYALRKVSMRMQKNVWVFLI